MLRYATIPALAATLLVPGCGSSKGPSNDPSSASLRSAGLQFASCMRSHGVPNFPDPSAGSGGGLQIQATQRNGQGQTMTVNGVPVNAPAFQSATNTCQKYMPKPKLKSGGITQLKANALKYGECMRSDGVPNFPDPKVQSGPNGGAGVQITVGSGIDPQAPAFKAAQQKCRSIMGLPAGGPGAPTSPNSQVPAGGSSGSG
jgi:hypothetical protein